MQKHDQNLATRFINHARNITIRDHGEAEYTKWFRYDDEALLVVPETHRNFAWYAHVISRCPSYEIERDLFKQAGEFRSKLTSKPGGFEKFKQSIIDHPELIRAPFLVMWCEFESEVCCTEDPFTGKPITPVVKAMRTGALIFNLPANSGIKVFRFSCLIGEAGITPAADRMESFLQTSEMKYRLELGESNQETMQDFRIATIQTLFFLKSRGSMLKLEPNGEGSFAKKRRHERMIKSGFIHKPLGKLTYDVSRLIQKGFAKTKEEALALIRETVIVMEHPKLRRVRRRDPEGNLLEGYEMRWITWSAHWRGGTEGQKRACEGKPVIAPRQARATMQHPERGLITPYLADVSMIKPKSDVAGNYALSAESTLEQSSGERPLVLRIARIADRVGKLTQD